MPRRWGGVVALMAVTVCVAAAAVSAAPVAPNDPLYSKQWALPMIGVPQAWATTTGKGVVIGEVDTGVDLTHEDLAGKVVASTNCIGSMGDPTQCHGNAQDDDGHGTHVAGVAAAVTGNALGVAGAAPDARLVVAKALDSSGRGSISDINAGIEWVVDHGAKIVNLSLGDPDFVFTSVFGTSLQQGIEFAWSRGAIPVLASGNSNVFGLGSSDYGNLDAVVVGAVGHDGALAAYSSPTGNAKWAVLAPGGSADGMQADDILSTYWVSGKTNQYGYLAGTSMATPYVSGVLALLLATGLTPNQAIGRLLNTANAAVSCGSGSTTCHGLVNAAQAVAGLVTAGSSTTLAPTPSSTLVKPAPVTTVPRPTAPAAPPPGPPTTLGAAPPAVMVPAHGASGPTPTTAAPGRAAPPPAAGTTTVSGEDLAGPAGATRHASSDSVLWFSLLAGAFAVIVALGIVRVLRNVPEV